MSQKTDLQSNNIDLQSILDIINNLPDAGGGSSGGALETCNVILCADAPTSGQEIVYYTDGTSTYKSIVFPSFMDGEVTIKVVKNSLIFCTNCYPNASNATIATRIPSNTVSDSVFFVSGNVTLYIM